MDKPILHRRQFERSQLYGIDYLKPSDAGNHEINYLDVDTFSDHIKITVANTLTGGGPKGSIELSKEAFKRIAMLYLGINEHELNRLLTHEDFEDGLDLS